MCIYTGKKVRNYGYTLSPVLPKKRKHLGHSWNIWEDSSKHIMDVLVIFRYQTASQHRPSLGQIKGNDISAPSPARDAKKM